MRLSLVLGGLLLVIGLMHGGCARASKADASSAWTQATPREGFWVSVTSSPNPGDASLPGLPSARFVLEADGQLRAAAGPNADETTFPPPIRRLSREQVDAVWSRLVAIQPLATSPSARISDTPPSAGASGTSTIRLTAFAHGRQRAAVLTGADPHAPQAADLVRQLADWAWMGAPAQTAPPVR